LTSASPEREPGTVGATYRWLVTITGMTAAFTMVLSGTIVNVAVPNVMGAFGVGAQALVVFGAQWETLIAVLLTLAILYFSEIIPKTLGATFWRQLIIPAAYLILWLVIPEREYY